MFTRRNALALALTGLLFGLLSVTLAAAGGQHRCHGGPGHGHWNLPGDHGPGFVLGSLFLEGESHALFRLEAGLHRTHPGQGVMEGVLRDVHDPHQIARFLVLGQWVADHAGNGVFEAAILSLHGGGHQRAGHIAGHFDDPPGHDPHHDPVGAFHAEWRICPKHD